MSERGGAYPGGGERTLGYRQTESILAVDAQVYVPGTVQQETTGDR